MHVYHLWRTATSSNTRPSDLLGIPDTPEYAYERFEVDAAVIGLGTYVDSKLEQRNSNHERIYKTVDAVLALACPVNSKRTQFKRGDLPAPRIVTREALAKGRRKRKA